MAAIARAVHGNRSSGGARPLVEKGGEPLAAVAHDARNVLAALNLFSDLLGEPGVLSAGSEHYAADLRMVARASMELVERLSGLRRPLSLPEEAQPGPERRFMGNIAASVHELAGPLELMVGKSIAFEMECLPCPGGVQLSKQDLARILMNLTRNAAEAMPRGGRIRVTLQQGDGGSFFREGRLPHWLPQTALLCVQDSGPGIPARNVERIFEAGFSTRKNRTASRRGLGLNIVRRLIEAAGGQIRAMSTPSGGARFEVELPLIDRRTPVGRFLTDFPGRSYLEC